MEKSKNEWTESTDAIFAEAVDAIAADMRDNGVSFEGSLDHYAELFEITPDALRHEWNLRKEDAV
jgi:hypothetical protein